MHVDGGATVSATEKGFSCHAKCARVRARVCVVGERGCIVHTLGAVLGLCRCFAGTALAQRWASITLALI